MTLRETLKKQLLWIVVLLPVIVACSLVNSERALAETPQSFPDPDHIIFNPLLFEPPKVKRIIFNNGLRLYILPDDELPLVEIKAIIGTGSTYDPPDREGLAELTATTMRTGGTFGMSSNAMDEALDSMAAAFGLSVNRDYSVFDFSVLKKDLNRGFGLFADTLMQPVFEENKLMQAKDLKIEELTRIFDDPQKLAFREFGRLMYEGSPRGRIVTSASIRQIQREDLIRFHKAFCHPANILLSITGNIEISEAQKLIERHFGHWVSPEVRTAPPILPRPRKGKIFFLTKDVPQSVVIIGWLAPDKRNTNFYPFEVMDFMIGSGGFRSRIFQEIRTNLGMAYSTGSFFNAKPDYGLFAAYAMTKSESTAEVTKRIRNILLETIEKPCPPDELERAKKAILNSFIFSFTSAEQIAFQNLMMEYEGLSDNFLSTYRSKIGNVKVEDIHKVASMYLIPGQELILILGNENVYQDITKTFGKINRIDAKF